MWSGAFLNFSTSYVAADRDGPRSGGGGIRCPPFHTTSGVDTVPDEPVILTHLMTAAPGPNGK